MGERAFIVHYGGGIDPDTHRKVLEFTRILEEQPFPGFVEAVPSYGAAAVYYDPIAVVKTSWKVRDAQSQVVRWLEERSERVRARAAAVAGAGAGALTENAVEIPVCYCSECGPDLPFVAERNQLSAEDVVSIHTSRSYKVYMIGFMPGFPYLGGMSERISAPRLSTPRERVPAGSVGIAGSQTGVYPFASPGGWRLIGRTPLPLFQPDRTPPSVLTAGDTVYFKPVSHGDGSGGM